MDLSKLSSDEFDELRNPGPEQSEFEKICEKAFSRRDVFKGGMKFGLAALALSSGAATLMPKKAKASRLAFDAVQANSLDTITVPRGYSWHTVVSWGDPLWSGADEFDHATRGTGASQELAFGDNNDGMTLFQHDGHYLLALNNEYTNLKVIHGNRESGKPESPDDVRKNMAAQGNTVVELANRGGRWGIVKDSPFNRRITPNTPMEITGPAAGHELMKTSADPSGTLSLGTWNNCANGSTPWGTYLTCEENFNGYYSSSDPDYPLSAEKKRYGIGHKDRGYGWATIDDRFDISKEPNESNRNGFVVEYDPADPNFTPKKRTALGRFKHENAEVVIAANGHAVVYLGDDERGEFLYRFVSERKYTQGGNNRDLLENGTLYVAKFIDDLRGEWVPLTPATTGMSEAEICIHSRIAASKVGATTMDRPEWVAANPVKTEVYCALTNNKNRGVKPNKGGDATPAGGPNPRDKNLYGQIVRWSPDNEDHTANGFTWDLFVTAGNPNVHSDAYAGSSNVTADNMFNSPDGIKFDPSGLLWIQTDGNYSNAKDFAGMGNNQMLCADTESGEIRRFMVGPNECEITGLTWSDDRKTLFVGIQHPGERGNSHFPGGGDSAPRSSIIAVTRQDGQMIV